MKIYTKGGDTGETSLYGGQRVAKDALRVEAYGTLDELNACLGMAIAALDQDADELATLLTHLQSELFDLGAELATPPERAQDKLAARIPVVGTAQVEALEAMIDRYDEQLSPLKNFILPGGASSAAALHLARTVARRAERRVVTLAAREPVNGAILRYLNRLSDLLFVLARAANRHAGIADVPWQPREGN